MNPLLVFYEGNLASELASVSVPPFLINPEILSVASGGVKGTHRENRSCSGPNFCNTSLSNQEIPEMGGFPFASPLKQLQNGVALNYDNPKWVGVKTAGASKNEGLCFRLPGETNTDASPLPLPPLARADRSARSSEARTFLREPAHGQTPHATDIEGLGQNGGCGGRKTEKRMVMI